MINYKVFISIAYCYGKENSMILFGNATEAVLGILILLYKSIDIISLILLVMIYRKLRWKIPLKTRQDRSDRTMVYGTNENKRYSYYSVYQCDYSRCGAWFVCEGDLANWNTIGNYFVNPRLESGGLYTYKFISDSSPLYKARTPLSGFAFSSTFSISLTGPMKSAMGSIGTSRSYSSSRQFGATFPIPSGQTKAVFFFPRVEEYKGKLAKISWVTGQELSSQIVKSKHPTKVGSYADGLYELNRNK